MKSILARAPGAFSDVARHRGAGAFELQGQIPVAEANSLDRWPERADHLRAKTKRQGQRETIAAGGVSLSARRGPPGFAVLRSNMCDRLSEFCHSLGELRRDAQNRVNILGVNCHAYLFTLSFSSDGILTANVENPVLTRMSLDEFRDMVVAGCVRAAMRRTPG